MRRTGLRALFSASFLLALAACAEDGSTPLAPAEGEVGQPLAAVTAQLSGRIAFTVPTLQGSDLFTINPDGTGRAPLVTLPGNEFSATWSWDNQTVAYLRSRTDAANIPHYEVYLVDKDGANGRWLTPQPLGIDVRFPVWSPDGSRILVDTNNFEILAIDVATGAKTTLPYFGEMPSFDPTGQLIAFSTPSSISVAEADGSGVVRTISGPGGSYVAYVRFSPDGKKLALAGSPPASNNSDIWLVNADGTAPVRLVGGPNIDSEPVWSPDGQTIVYTSTKRGRSELWRIPMAGGHRTRVTSGGGVQPAWTH